MVSVSALGLQSYKRAVTSTDLVQADICDVFFRLLVFQTGWVCIGQSSVHFLVDLMQPRDYATQIGEPVDNSKLFLVNGRFLVDTTVHRGGGGGGLADERLLVYAYTSRLGSLFSSDVNLLAIYYIFSLLFNFI